MAKDSAIEWTDATWNPVTGCTQISPGCDHCYALTFAERFRGVPGHHFEQGFDLRLWPERLDLPLRWKQPRRIFVDSMSDLFHSGVPDDFVRSVFDTMVRADWHIYQILTKRPQKLARMAPMLPWPQHIWVGVSVESNEYVWRADFLRSVPASVRFISAEPLLGSVDQIDLTGIQWVIAGGESGPGFRPCDPEWVRSLRDRCVASRVAFFFKQWGGRSHGAGGRVLDGRTWDEFPHNDGGRGDLTTTGKKDVEQVFFDELKDWSEIKLRILEKYLRAYMNKRGGTNPRVYYVDGFAGPGHYVRDGAIAQEGSPIRIARYAQSIADASKSYRLICLNSEIRAERCQRLMTALSGFDPDLVQVLCGPFLDHLPSILAQIGRAPAIFFLDPFGVKEITPADLRPLLRRSDTELLLNFNTPRLRKLAGFEDSESPDARKKVELVSRALGEDPSALTPEWLQVWRQLKNGVHWERWAAQIYADRLLRDSPFLRHALAYPIREHYGSNPKYYLVFLTRSSHAMPIMNDLLCSEEDGLFDKVKGGKGAGQLGFFDVVRQSELDRRLTDLIQDIYAYGTAHQECSIDHLIEHFVFERPAEFKKKHYREAVKRLQQDGRVRFGTGQRDSAPLTFL